MPSRPPRVFWWLVGTVGGVVLLFAAVWLAIGWRYASGVPTPDPSHLAQLEAMRPVVAAEDAAWPRLVAAHEGIGRYFAYNLGDWARLDREPLDSWEADTPAEVERWLRAPENLEALSRLVGVPLEHPVLGGLDPINLVYPALATRDGPHRTAALAVEAEAVRAIRGGDAQAAARAIDSLLGIAAMTDERPLLPQFEDRREILRSVLHQISAGLATGGWRELTLRDLDAALAGIDPVERLRIVLDGEALYAASVRAAAFTDDGAGDGRITPAANHAIYEANAEYLLVELIIDDGNPGMTSSRGWDLLGGPLVLRWAPGRAEARTVTEALLADATELLDRSPPSLAAVSVPAPPRRGHLARIRSRFDPNTRLKHDLLPAVQDTLSLGTEVLAARLALAAVRFRLAHERVPADVEELHEAGFLDDADREAFQPFRLTVRGERLVVVDAAGTTLFGDPA